MVKKCLDVKVNVKPVFCFLSHQYYYEGPCRMAGGDALQPGFDDILNGQIQNGVSMGIKYACPPDIANVMDPNVVITTDNWDMKDEYMAELMKDHDDVDVYIIFCSFGSDRIWREFGKKCESPLLICTNIWNPMKSAYYTNNGVEVYTPYDWAEVTDYLRAFRAKKAIAVANILLVVRFSETMSFAGADDSFRNLDEVTAKFGTHFRPVNFHEIMEQMKVRPEEGYCTTPGRMDTPHMTEEDIAELERIADEIMSGAEVADITKEYMMNSLKAWRVINKNMDYFDCSAVAIPCPDCCSTKRLNESKFTFCLNHQLNHELGIPSACKYDIAAAVTMLAEICLSGNVPYMANTLPIIKSANGQEQWITQIPEEDQKAIPDHENLYCVNMSPMMRTKKVGGTPDRYRVNHFAYDQGFGAIFHHDFNDDIGEKVTLARLSGDCRKLMIVRGEIVKGYGYELNNCNGGFIFRVSDNKKMYKEQAKIGLMLPMIFGDYSAELEKFAEVMGLETVII